LVRMDSRLVRPPGFVRQLHRSVCTLRKGLGSAPVMNMQLLNDAVYRKTGNYTMKLAKALIHAVIMSRRNP